MKVLKFQESKQVLLQLVEDGARYFVSRHGSQCGHNWMRYFPTLELAEVAFDKKYKDAKSKSKSKR